MSHLLHDMEERVEDVLHGVEEVLHDVVEGLSEHDFIERSHHKKLEHLVLLVRNIAVGIAVLLFLISLFHIPYYHILKGVAYFLGAGAYFCEICLLTDCFTTRVEHHEMFMAYCFGPMYILLGLSYLLGH